MKTVRLKIPHTLKFFFKLQHLAWFVPLDPDVTGTPSLTENGQTPSNAEKSTLNDGDTSERTDKDTLALPLVPDDQQPCGEEGGGEDGIDGLEQTNKDV